ncbi:MAG: NAD-dependent deacetylase [Rhodocyclales bacterium]|nr:NAD-dependent deacetylase [Rhodocyclales bacterium]
MTALADGYAAAARLIEQADALVICAGAGMGVDSGLPDFRGPGGFWQAYPALGRARIRFEEIASPAAFRRDPEVAWGFYGHRLNLYRATVPHEGFGLLRELAASMPRGGVVFTSNVDGHFQRAGFGEDRVTECHGSIHHLQCLEPCSDAIWSAADLVPEVDVAECRIRLAMPRCPNCGALARPAILMFGDRDWIEGRTREQERRLADWLRTVERPLVIEVGAGSTVATVRAFVHSLDAPLIRINPREPEVVQRRDVGLGVGAREGISGIVRSSAGGKGGSVA